MAEETPRGKIVIPLPLKLEIPKLRWAVIYARVSSTHEPQETSLENQINYLKMVAQEMNYHVAEVYAEKRSAKGVNDRPEFKRMIQDSDEKKFDLVLVKSVERLGRNTVDVLQGLQRLHSNGVRVYFDMQSIYSDDGKNTHLITVLEACAQEQNRWRSENIKWGIERSLSKPDSRLYQRACFGYQLGAGGFLEIKEDEAQSVRKIFTLYLGGYSILALIRTLESESVLSPTGKTRWSKRAVDTMLSNEKYMGNVIVGKTYVEEYPSAKRRKNEGERSTYLLQNSHPPIISKEIFEQVQVEKVCRSNISKDEAGTKRRSTRYSMKKSRMSSEE